MQRILIIITTVLLFFPVIKAQSPNGKQFGFGIIVGDPTGLTVKYWTARNTAFTAAIGASYFGSPRLQFDYIWHFDAFNSDIAKLYAGPGGAIGFGEGRGFWYKRKGDYFYVRPDNELGIGLRGVFGLNVIPRVSPLEFFLELGVLVGLAPDFGSAVDAALGMRFYP